MIVLAELQPLDTVAGVRKTLRATNANIESVTGLNGQVWRPAIVRKPKLSIRLFSGDFDATIDPGGGTLALLVDQLVQSEAAARRFAWQGAPVKIWAGKAGDAWPWTQVFEGLVAERPTADGNRVSLTVKVNTEPFDADVLTAKYAGTGGIEGGADLKDRVKPWLLGRCFNVEPVTIDETNSVYQFSAYGPIQAVTNLYERGSDFGASMGDYASYAALVAAAITPGRWATCLAQGLVRLGAPQAGIITGDVDGDATGGTWRRKTGEIVTLIANNCGAGAMLEAASLSALDTALTGLTNEGRIGIVLTEQEKLLALTARLAAPCNAQAGVSQMGKLFTTLPAIGSPVATLDAQQRQMPRVTASSEEGVSPPFSLIQMGYAKCWRVHSYDEISYYATIIDRGRYAAGEFYREGNIVDLEDGSRWLYINPVPGSGNAPPTWPTTSNAHWENITPPSTLLTTAYLTNEAHNVATAPDGSGGDYSSAGGTFKVFHAGTDVTTSSTFAAVASTGGLAHSGGSPNVSIDAGTGVYTITGCTADQGTVTFRATYNSMTIDKIYSLVKSKNGKMLMVISDRQTIYYDGTGAATPATQTTTFTAQKQNTSATVNWSLTDINGTPRTPVTSFLSSATGDSVTMTEAQFASARNGTTGVIVSGTLTDGVTLTDKISVIRVSQGATGSAGTPGTNGNNNATVFLYKRTTTNTAPALPFLTVTYTFATGVASGVDGGWTQTVPTTGGDYLWMTTAQAISTGINDTILSAEWAAAALVAPPGRAAAVFYQGTAPSSGMIEGDLWYDTTSKRWYRYTSGSWTITLGDVSALNIITQAYIANAAIGAAQIGDLEVTNAKIANLSVGTSKIAGGSVSVPSTTSGSDTFISAGTTVNVLETSQITVGDSTDGQASILVFGEVDSGTQKDVGGRINLYADVNDGSGYVLKGTSAGGVRTTGGDSYVKAAVLAACTVTSTSWVKVKLEVQSIAMPGGSAQSFTFRGPQIMVFGAQR